MTPEMLSLLVLVAELTVKVGPRIVEQVQALASKPGVTTDDFLKGLEDAKNLKDPEEYRHAK